MIEHRYSRRRSIEADAILNYRNLGLVQGKARNISLGGLFVDLGCVQLPLNVMVSVTLVPPDEDVTQVAELEAMVVHQADGGVGLMISNFGTHGEMLVHNMVHIDDPVRTPLAQGQIRH